MPTSTTSTTTVIDPELFKIFCFWGSILALKLLAMLPLTARARFGKKVFLNPEDVDFVKSGKIAFNDPDVERVRRAHLNDLENIPVWYVVTYLWLTTGPSIWLAAILIKAFVIARIMHTLVYVIFPKQPHRAIAFFTGFFITVYQTISTLLYHL